MPYISPKLKPRLNPHINEITRCIVERLKAKAEDRENVWLYLRYAGLNLVTLCGLQINLRLENRIRLRYWQTAFAEALFTHVAKKLKRRRKLRKSDIALARGCRNWYARLVVKKLDDTLELDKGIAGLVREIVSISNKKPKDLAFFELCNYSLTTLGPRLIMEVYGGDFNQELLQFLAFFWTKVADDFYEESTAPYEKKQMLINGDCEVFAEMERRLGKV